MENLSAVTSFILTAYTDLEDHRYLYFMCFLVLYILIILSNAVLIAAICSERGLHEPMYLFICNLLVNGVYGSTALLPLVLHNLLSYNYEISLTACLIQIFFLHTYSRVEFTALAVMGYDRYVAICHPLHYHHLMSRRKMCGLIAFSWMYPFIFFGLYFILTVQRTFCDRILERIYCGNIALVKVACLDASVHRIIGLVLIVFSPSPQIIVTLVSYAQIFRICLHASKESQAKAIQTCTPHLLALINYMVGCTFEILQSHSSARIVPPKPRIFMTLYFLIIPPLFNPIIYGISIQAIKVQIFKHFSCKKRKSSPLMGMIK